MLPSYTLFEGSRLGSFKDNRNSNNHGIMELTFSCAVFNFSGFYSRNLAILSYFFLFYAAISIYNLCEIKYFSKDNGSQEFMFRKKTRSCDYVLIIR